MKVTKCQECGVYEAVVHITDIEKGKCKERSLCDDCAQKEGVVCGYGTLKPENLLKIIERKIEDIRKTEE